VWDFRVRRYCIAVDAVHARLDRFGVWFHQFSIVLMDDNTAIFFDADCNEVYAIYVDTNNNACYIDTIGRRAKGKTLDIRAGKR
jgi:hypothetical protein